MTISMNNKNDLTYQALFDELVQEVFGFSFEPWFEYELWDENYESYSIIENSKMLSNVCIFKSNLIVNGHKLPAIQFGAVATTKNARGKGLSRILIEHVLSLYPDRLAYLAANPSVVNFYPQFGFKQVQTYKAEIPAAVNNKLTTATKCDIDDEIVMQALQNRGTFSNLIDCTNSMSIQMFHLIMQYHNAIYYLPGLKTVIIAEQKNNRLFLADVITQSTQISFDELIAELPFSGVDTIEFGFCPDWLSVMPNWIPTSMTDDPFFIRGNWNLPNKFRFPLTSET